MADAVVDGGESLPEGGWAGMFRALRYPNYRLYWGGQAVSLVGTWMQSAAQQWLVYRLTGSALLLGVTGFLGHVPSLVLGPLAGLVLDRVDRRSVLLVTQVLSLVQALLMSWLVLTDRVAVWHILAMAFVLGLVSAIDMPARHSFVADIVERKEDFGNAIALNSMLFHGSRMVGPPVAGLLIHEVGEGYCFLVNGLSFLAIIGALAFMRFRPRTVLTRREGWFESLREGFVYAFGTPLILSLLLNVMLVSLLVMPYQIVMPVFVKQVLLRDSGAFGLLMGAGGLGAVFGAVYLATRRGVGALWYLIPGGSVAAGAALFGLASTRTLPVAFALLVLVGFGTMTQFASANTLLQSLVDDAKRGRVMSLYTTSFAGLMPFGNLLLGRMTDTVGPENVLRVCGASCVLAALLFLERVVRLRPTAPRAV